MSTKILGPKKPRVDFERNDFDGLIREKGYRVMWSAGELCPCRLNAKTETPDPSCDLCGGGGYFYTLPDPEAPEIDEYVREIPPFRSTAESRATQAVITSMTKDPQEWEKFGEWVSGTASLTTFSFNRVGYRDRFKVVDHTALYRQVLIVPEDQKIKVGRDGRRNLRYPAVRLIRAFEVTSAGLVVNHTKGTTVNADGTLTLNADPGARVSISYEMHPVWIVVDFPHFLRGTLIKQKTTKVLGAPEQLPVHAFVRLDYLVDGSNPSPA